MAAVSVTAANVLKSANGIQAQGTSGATITAGQPIYIDSADSYKVKLADSDLSVAAAVVRGISLNGASAGQLVDFVVSDPSFTPGFTALAGDDVWLFDAAGQITVTKADLEAGDTVVHLGVMLTTTTMNLNITIGGIIAA